MVSQTLDDYLDELTFSITKQEAESIPVLDLSPDPRLKLLSHSSRLTLHSCPRKYQLYRLSSKQAEIDEDVELTQSITFAYGHAVGLGIQLVLQGVSLDKIIFDLFISWEVDLLVTNPKQNKSFWLAINAVSKFFNLRNSGYLKDYELVYVGDNLNIPAIELSFQINLPKDYKYRGFVDAVLKHKVTGEVLVVELKTTSGSANSANYKNSGQALGYSVILDQLFPELSSYTVLYLVQETKSGNYVELPFSKSLLQRALWLQELLIDTEILELYSAYDIFPTHGESCFSYFRNCEYLGLCHMNTSLLSTPLTSATLAKLQDTSAYMFIVDFSTLVQTQIDKLSSSPSPSINIGN